MQGRMCTWSSTYIRTGEPLLTRATDGVLGTAQQLAGSGRMLAHATQAECFAWQSVSVGIC